MASIAFDIQMSKAQLDNLTKRIKRSVEAQAPVLAFAMISEIGQLPAVDRFVKYTRTPEFVSEFGIHPLDAAEMHDRLSKTFTVLASISEHSIIKKAANGDLVFNLLSEQYLRGITEHIWAPTAESTSNKAPILVNAWDIYEYGIVGSDFTGGRIKDAYLSAIKSDIQKKYSRSDESIMIRKSGAAFRFGKGNAPKIFSIRSSILKNVDKIEKNSLDIIRKFGKVGSA